MNDNSGWVIDGLPLDGDWQSSCGCPPKGSANSTVDTITITGSPGAITSVENSQALWAVVLNDGTPQADFRLDRFNGGFLTDSPLTIVRATGVVTFHDPVMLSRDPIEPMEAVTREWAEANLIGVTEAPEDGRIYTRGNATWIADPIQADAPNDGVAYVRQSLGWATLSAQLTGYMPLAGGTFTGPVTFQGSNMLALVGASGQQRGILGGTTGPPTSFRWQMLLGDQTAESGANSGSNFALSAISDTGTLLSTPLAIARSTGAITVGVTPGATPLTLNGPGASWRSIAGATNGSMRWQMYLGNPSAELGGNLGSNFQLNSYSDTGAVLTSPLTIARQTGVATFSALPSFPGGLANYVLSTNGSGTLAWAYSIPEAPLDGQQYARRNAAWSPFVSGPPTTISDTAPANPQAGQLWWDSVGGQMYVFYPDANSSQWVPATNVGSVMPPATTTTLGAVKVDGTSIKAAVDGTISVTVVPMGDNRLINGDMRINQRGVGSATTIGYTVDRWQYSSSGQNVGAWAQGSNAATMFPYYLAFQSSSAYVSAASDYFRLLQIIEADMISDFQFGLPTAQPITLSFSVATSIAGTFSGVVGQWPNATRSYPFTFNIPTAGTWTKIAVTIPGDTAGTWVATGNGGALTVQFDLGSGTQFRGPANAWAASNFVGATGSQSIVATNGAWINLTGVKLEIGSVATPYNRQSLAKSLADCQRYYQANAGLLVGSYAAAGGSIWASIPYITTMRANPTVALSNQAYNNGSGLAAQTITTSNFQLTSIATAAGATWGQCNATFSAEL